MKDVWRSKCVWSMKRAIWVWMMFRCFVFRMMYPAVIVSHSRISFWNVMRFYLTLLHVSFWHRVQWNQLSGVFVFWLVQFHCRQYIHWQNKALTSKTESERKLPIIPGAFCYNKLIDSATTNPDMLYNEICMVAERAQCVATSENTCKYKKQMLTTQPNKELYVQCISLFGCVVFSARAL